MTAPSSQTMDRAGDPVSWQDLNSSLPALARLVGEDPKALERVGVLSERLRSGTFHLAILGQFKRGKSTLIDALLGAPLLPVAVVPLTAVPIFVSWGARTRASVSFLERPAEEFASDDPKMICDFLFSFVTEDANPKNSLGVKRVDLSYPAPMLSHGMVLIDTPGVGSTYRHNTETAFEVLSECDAALFVVSVDPPITEVELGFLKEIKSKTAKLLFALNKIDYLEPEHHSQVADFLRRTLIQNGLWDEQSLLFSLSAQKGLEAKESGDRDGLVRSGLSDLEKYLTGVLSAQKGRLLRIAIQAKASRIVSEYRAGISLRIRALELPLDDLVARNMAFQRALASIEAQRQTTRDILDGDRRRLRRELEERTEQLLVAVQPQLQVVAAQLAGAEQLQDQTSALIVDIFERARREFLHVFEARFETALQRHQARITELIDIVRRTAGTIFEAPFPAWSEFDGFEFGVDPYWVTEKIQTGSISASIGFFGRLLPMALSYRRRTLRILDNLEEIALRNAENLRWAVLRGIDETFRRADGYFEAQIGEAIATTNDIIREAVARKQSAAAAADHELEELAAKAALLDALDARFRSDDQSTGSVVADCGKKETT